MIARVLLALAVIVTVHSDSYDDFITTLGTIGVQFPAAGMKSICNCTIPTVYGGGNASTAADKFKNCALSYCLGNYATCSKILQAISTNDQCLKPQSPSTTTMQLIDKLMPKLVPLITKVYNNVSAIVMKNKNSGQAQYPACLGGFTYANTVVNRNYMDGLCQGLLPFMTALEQTCAFKNLQAIVNVAGYVCATKMSAAG